MFMGHFEEEQVGELLDVVAVGHAVVAQDVAVVPEFLDDVLGVVVRICAIRTDTVRIRWYTGHRRSFSGSKIYERRGR